MEEFQIRPKNFDQICRLCLEYASDENVLFPLFINDANIPGFYGRFLNEFKESIPEVISTCTGIEIDPSEKLPLNICSICEKQLITTNQFRRKCWQSNEFLREVRLTDEADFDTEDNTLNLLNPPELILVDNFKEENEEDEEMDSSCDSVWDNLEAQTTVADITPTNEKLSVKTEIQSVIKKAAMKRSTTIPLVTPSTPIVPVNCSEATDRKENKHLPKNVIKHVYPKKPKMCTVCGVMVDRLRDHMRTHPDKLEYGCSNCPRRYLTTKGLSKHIRLKHTEDSSFENKINGGQGEDADMGCNKNLWQCNLRKRFRQMGETYIGVDGTVKIGRTVKKTCPVSCYLRCQFNVDEAQRILIHKSFWKLTDDEKYSFYARNVQRVYSLRKRTKAERSRRIFSFVYFFDVCENGVGSKRVQICQKFFINTLDISKGRVYYYFQNIYDSKEN